MQSGTLFRDLVSGRRRGLAAAVARGLLALAEVPYTAVVRRRNRYYDDPTHVHRASVPVVSIGNLTLGGTGKTPLVAWLARWFQQRGVRVAIVSRGYGAKAGHANDEALELARLLPGVPHVQNADRRGATNEAIEQHGAQLVLLDDGMQHRRLARDLDIALVDALEPDGFGRVFPRGTLRESLTGWQRAQIIVLSRADLVAPARRAEIRQLVASYAPRAAWVEAVHRPCCLRLSDGTSQSLVALQGERVAAFCGIGNPSAFEQTLRQLDCNVVGLREFADHHAFTAAELTELSTWADRQGARLVCTLKDLVKIDEAWLSPSQAGRSSLAAVEIGLEFTTGEAALIGELERLARQASVVR